MANEQKELTKFQKFFAHLKTIRQHRRLVIKWAFKMGIPLLGLLHDLSKYRPSELIIYKWYSPTRSPHEVCREELGYSPTHSLHKWRNKHHSERWQDHPDSHTVIPIKIPYKYVIEMFCDMVSTGKVYYKENWTPAATLEYYTYNKLERCAMHPDSEKLLLHLMIKLYTLNSEKAFIKWYRKNKKELKKNY